MPLFFRHVCDLLSTLEEISTHDPPYLPSIKYEKQRDILHRWFCAHKSSIDASSDIAVAVFSAILPARRPDRVYNIQYSRLVSLLKRCLCLGIERQRMLDQWRVPGRGDLADCVERVLQQTDDPLTLASTVVTLKDVDIALATLASKSRFSGPKAREYEIDHKIQISLENIFRRLHSKEAKWLTRMILKDLSCLDVKESVVYSAFDSRLPAAMEMYDDLQSALSQHRKLLDSEKAASDLGGELGRRANSVWQLIPQLGTKVGRPRWVKAKGGVKNAISIIDGRIMSIERKYDGEYCQIHVDLVKGKESIQIFSKSGKDSTIDRKDVHDAIKEALRIGHSDCQFSRNCIVEGELLVWCDKKSAILEFHKIRKHVARSGTFLGTTEDSQPHPWEHLMIVFYDVLLIDDEPIIHRKHDRRRQHLKRIVKKIAGKSDIVWRTRVDFSKPGGSQKLTTILADALTQRWEGLVLKPAGEPYFHLKNSRTARYPSSWVKLKKDCIAGLGDTADLMVIGAAYDGKVGAKLKISNLSWTHFYIACLTNKEEVVNQRARPSLLVFDCIYSLRNEDIKLINQHGQFRAMESNSDEVLKNFHLSYTKMDLSLPRMSVVFKEPFVFEIAGSGFDEAPNQSIFTLRFPRVVKIHWDRDWRESVSLDELQTLASEARTLPPSETSRQEHQEWVKKLDLSIRGAEGKRVAWDDTEDEEEPPEISRHAVLLKTSPTSSCKARTPVSPALVRMDTGEMGPGEIRSKTGEVIKISNLKWPIGNRESVSSLYRTCSSPPVANMKEQTKDQAVATNIGITPTRARRSPKKHTSEPKSSLEMSATSHKRPLQEMTNSARPSQRRRGPSTHDGHQKASKADFELVRKVPAGASIYPRNWLYKASSRHKKVPTSPARDTSESAPTSTTTSQITMAHSSPPICSTPPSSLLLTPSPINKPTLPDLATTQIILNPHLNDSTDHANTISHLLKTVRSTQQTPLPCYLRSNACQHRSPSSHQFTKLPLAPLIFLIDNYTHPPTAPPSAVSATARSLHHLAIHLPQYHPHPIQIWDWRALHHQTKPPNPASRSSPPPPSDTSNHTDDEAPTDASTDTVVKECYIATMSLEAPVSEYSDACAGEGTVVMQWGDGAVTKKGMGWFVELAAKGV